MGGTPCKGVVGRFSARPTTPLQGVPPEPAFPPSLSGERRGLCCGFLDPVSRPRGPMPFLTLASFVLFTGLVALGTWLLTRRKLADSSEGYFLAGRSLTAGYIAGSLLLTNLSTEQLVGLNGAAFADGLSVMAWEVIAAASLVVMALV